MQCQGETPAFLIWTSLLDALFPLFHLVLETNSTVILMANSSHAFPIITFQKFILNRWNILQSLNIGIVSQFQQFLRSDLPG